MILPALLARLIAAMRRRAHEIRARGDRGRLPHGAGLFIGAAVGLALWAAAWAVLRALGIL